MGSRCDCGQGEFLRDCKGSLGWEDRKLCARPIRRLLVHCVGLLILVGVILATPALAEFDAQHPPPDWMERGFEAAINDSAATRGGIEIDADLYLSTFVPPGRAGPVIDKLLPLLGDRDPSIRAAAVQALGRIPTGDRASTIIDRLLPFLSDSNSSIRGAAIQALGQIATGVRAGPVIDKLLPLLSDQDRTISAVAAQALGQIATGERAGPVIDKLLPLLGDPNSSIRAAAIQALGQIATGARAGATIDKLLPLLNDQDRAISAAAAQALGQIATGERAAPVTDRLLKLLGDPISSGAATQALGQIATGERAGTVIDELLPLLHDPNSSIKGAAIQALGKIAPSTRTGPVIDKLLPLLGDPNSSIRSAAAQVLGQIATGEHVGPVIAGLLPLLGDPDSSIKRGAIASLGQIATGARAGPVIDKLLPFLGDQDASIVYAAAQALGQIATGERAGAAINALLPLLDNPNSPARSAAARALGQIATGARARPVIDKLLPLLGDPDPAISAAAAQALGQIATDERAGPVIVKLLPLLNDPNSSIVRAAAQVLGQIARNERAGPAIDQLLPLLHSTDSTVSSAAALALGQIATGKRAGPVINELLPLLGSSKSTVVRRAAAEALNWIGPGDLSASLSAIRLINSREDEAAGVLRAAAHIAIGADGKDGSERLLAWLGAPDALPRDSVANNPAEAQKVLQLLTDHWKELSISQRTRIEAENTAMAAIEAACRAPTETSSLAEFLRASIAWLRDLPIEGPVRRCWTSDQRRTLGVLLTDFNESHSTHAEALAALLRSEDIAPVSLWLTRSVVLWALFWAAFLIAFPWSRTIQAIFFWNPRARKFFSAGFVPLLLLILPPLRRRLLAPFRDDLIAQARLEDFAELAYFADGRASLNDGEPVRLSQLRSDLTGVVVLQADSGLGKTSFLREIAAKATRPVAFLHARDCAEGVDVAISRIIHGVQEAGFVRSLVHTRALQVIVDGLNEVEADTREKIRTFARDMSKGDVIVATQPIEWRPPANSREVELLPLDRAEATAFLMSRPVGADETQPCQGEAYKEAVQKFVASAFDEPPPQIERETAELMLSNPFDLTFAAELMARGHTPSPTALVDEAYRLAAERYQSTNLAAFPLEKFGKHAVKMRTEDRNRLTPDEFPAEASCLQEQRLLVPRAIKGAHGKEKNWLLFRHERVWDFFIAAAFKDPDLWSQHIDDARFRGVYLRIAETWDPESAERVMTQLNVSAAHSGDHSTSDEFIKRLDKRFPQIKKSQKLQVKKSRAR
jgi:HEAT repeat protein